MSRILLPFARLVIGVCALSAAFAASPSRAADRSEEIRKAIDRAVKHVQTLFPSENRTPAGVLLAYSLLKAGEPPESPAIDQVVKAIEDRCSGATYQATAHHLYVAGLELMLLESLDPVQYRPQMQKILNYIVLSQREYGAWYYPNQQGLGDTSITQYAVLGLWAAERANLAVPRETWDRMAGWHLKTQQPDGGFAYHPDERGIGQSSRTMTAAGTANLILARTYLFPGTGDLRVSTPRRSPTRRYGILERVEPEGGAGPNGNGDAPKPASVKTSRTAVEQAVKRAMVWTENGFSPRDEASWPYYYLYGIERLAALANTQMLGSADWYQVGAEYLLRTQNSNGSWAGGNTSGQADSAFGILFLVRATNKMLGREIPGLGAGLLAGGRGLPDNLNAIAGGSGGDVEQKKVEGPLDDLLSRLENPAAADVPAVQEAVLDAVRFGDRQTLIGQRDRLRKLVNHTDPEVRRTVYWAFGRSGNVKDAELLIRGVQEDPDIGAAIEAHNALCVMALRPNAFGLPANPWVNLAESASDAERAAAVRKWRADSTEKWIDWYRRIGPYDELEGRGPLPKVRRPE